MIPRRRLVRLVCDGGQELLVEVRHDLTDRDVEDIALSLEEMIGERDAEREGV